MFCIWLLIVEGLCVFVVFFSFFGFFFISYSARFFIWHECYLKCWYSFEQSLVFLLIYFSSISIEANWLSFSCVFMFCVWLLIDEGCVCSWFFILFLVSFFISFSARYFILYECLGFLIVYLTNFWWGLSAF